MAEFWLSCTVFALIFVAWKLIEIVENTARIADIAEREEAARAEHRRKTMEDRKKEREDRGVSSAIQIVRSVANKVRGYKLRNCDRRTSPSSATFTYKVREGCRIKYVKISATPGPVSEVSVQVCAQENMYGVTGELRMFSFPDHEEDIQQYIFERLEVK